MTAPATPWKLIVHGGAKPWDEAEAQANREGVCEAAKAGARILAQGGSAVDAVEAAIMALEDRPVFNAGHGSVPNEAGDIEMCAGLVSGLDLAAGAVGAIRGVRNPIGVARLLLAEKEVLLVGDGAHAFAKAHGATLATDTDLQVEEGGRSVAEGVHDTVGAVALDRDGNLAAGTSTGGLSGQKVGRIGDSPLPGGGLYADNQVGAVCFSGHGETIARLTLAARVMAAVDQGTELEQAIADAVARLPATGGAEADGGGIGIDKAGRIGWTHNSPMFAVAWTGEGMGAPKVFLKKGEEGAAGG